MYEFQENKLNLNSEKFGEGNALHIGREVRSSQVKSYIVK